MKAIQDEFTPLAGTISRQQLYQMRHRADGLCVLCCQPAAADTVLCKDHAMAQALRISKLYSRRHQRQRQSNGRWITEARKAK